LQLADSSRNSHSSPDTPRLEQFEQAGTQTFFQDPFEAHAVELLPLLRATRQHAGKLSSCLLSFFALAMHYNAAIPFFSENVERHLFVLGLLEDSQEVVSCIDKEFDVGASVRQGKVVRC